MHSAIIKVILEKCLQICDLWLQCAAISNRIVNTFELRASLNR